mgnify:CR=1 FL=1
MSREDTMDGALEIAAAIEKAAKTIATAILVGFAAMHDEQRGTDEIPAHVDDIWDNA